MVALTNYRLTRIATVLQWKELKAPQGTDEEAVIAAAEGTPWKTAKVFVTDGVTVEED